MDENEKMPRAEMCWYHNVGFILFLSAGALIIMAGFLLVGSQL
jgi:hypothetical protein